MDMQKATKIILFIALFFTLAIPAQAAQMPETIEVYFAPMHFSFDGKQFAPPQGQRGFIYEGSTYVPLRFVAYALNKGVRWDGDTYTVTIAEPNDSEKIQIQEYNMNREIREPADKDAAVLPVSPETIQVYKEQLTYIFDGVQKMPPEEYKGFIYQDVLYVPIRFVSESIGKTIEWDPATYTVSAKSGQQEAPTPAQTAPSSSPSPSAAPASGGGGGGGGGGGSSSSKPSYDSLVQEADSKIRSLQSSAEATFNDLLNQYKEAADLDAKNAIIAQGINALASYDSRFENIMAELETKLKNNGYSTDIIQTYRDQYEKEKEAQKVKVMNSLLQ